MTFITHIELVTIMKKSTMLHTRVRDYHFNIYVCLIKTKIFKSVIIPVKITTVSVRCASPSMFVCKSHDVYSF